MPRAVLLANDGVRFLLELAALAALVAWGWDSGEAWWSRVLLGLVVPALAATAWAVFRVPNDPGSAPVAVPGPLRLLLEAAFFVGATLALAATGQT
ncbi:MAG: YrdB family protein, partial [Dehalococcoidia bacterium]